MTMLMVTPYPPYRDGIGAYAVQEIRRLRESGAEIEVLSPLPSAANHHLALGSVRGVLALIKTGRRYETVILQFSPEMMFGACRTAVERVAVWAGLEALARVTRLEVRLHEIEFGPLRRNPGERFAAGRALRAAATVAVHTRPEIHNLASALRINPDQVTLVEHGQNFAMATESTQAEARAELMIDPDRHVFLAIGFLQEHKGFDIAVDAFGRAGLSDAAELHVVGSVRVDHRDLLSYARRLEQQCRGTAGASLHQKYVSDEEFDRWIVAADTVVLPYREIWSSSVLERAKLYDRPIIAADVGGMADQAPPGTLLFDDTEALVQALKERAQTTSERLGRSGWTGPPGSISTSRPWQVDDEGPDRVGIEAQIRARARADRTGRERTRTDGGTAIDALLSVAPVSRPHAVSARPGVSFVKRLIRRVTSWELDPIVAKVEALHRATTEAVDHLDARINVGPEPERGERLIEEPFVHGALADLPLATSVLLIDGDDQQLARSLAAAGQKVTVMSSRATTLDHRNVRHHRGPLSDLSDHFGVVVVTSAALTTTLHDEAGWLDHCRRLIAEDGRVVLGLPYQRLEKRLGPLPYNRADLGELLRGWTIRHLSVGARAPGQEWQLEATELMEPSSLERLVLLVMTL